MALTKVEGVILKTQAYGDTSVILRLYTRELGKLSAIAKGARRPKSPFGGVLDNLNLVAAILYYHETRDLHTLKECDLVDGFAGLRDHFDRTAVAMGMAELLHRTGLEGEPQPEVFQALVDRCRALAGADRRFVNFYWAFALRLLEESGTRLEWEQCAMCGGALPGTREKLSLEHGGTLCPRCAGTVVCDAVIGMETRKAGAYLANCPADRAGGLAMSPRALQELEQVLTRYMRYHLAGYRESVSLKMLASQDG